MDTCNNYRFVALVPLCEYGFIICPEIDQLFRVYGYTERLLCLGLYSTFRMRIFIKNGGDCQ